MYDLPRELSGVAGLPRTLSLDELSRLLEGRTRLAERLARRENPLGDAAALCRDVPEDELIEALNAHPRIGALGLSALSAREQGGDEDPALLDELARLNRAYEEKFGFRFVVFVNRRPRSDILRILRDRLSRLRDVELQQGVTDLLAIAADRYRMTHAARPGDGA